MSICRAFDCCDKDSFMSVLRAIADELGLEFIKKVFRTGIVKNDVIDSDSIRNIKRKIEQIIPTVLISKYHKDTRTKKKILFPLLRLPIDIIKNTSLFLNEEDIFSFEQCCCLFYQMINNLSYLKQSNNFKTFTLDDTRFDQIIESKYSFYKYSQSKLLSVTAYGLGSQETETDENITKFINQTQSHWEQARRIDRYNGYWLTNLFKSIESLKLHPDSTLALLDKLPLDILFDPCDSKLQRLTIDHYWNRDGDYGHLQKAINTFENEYSKLKEKYIQESKRIKKLKQLEHDGALSMRITGPCGIETEHLIVQTHSYHDVRVELEDIFKNSKVKILTCYHDFNADISKLAIDNIKKNCNSNYNYNYNIDTLRLINFSAGSQTSICVNDNMIQTLNLHKSLINLTINLILPFHDKKWIKTIEKILLKQHYHNLKNVNVLMQIHGKNIKQLFDMLKKNVAILRHQFEKLNFGLKIQIPCQAGKYFTHTFQWNSGIDAKYLDAKQEKLSNDQTYQEVNTEHDTHTKNFDKLLSQWL